MCRDVSVAMIANSTAPSKIARSVVAAVCLAAWVRLICHLVTRPS